MTTRREFLQAGLAVSALPFGTAPVTPQETLSGDPPLFYKVVFDERFRESVDFAHEMKRRGLDVYGINGDMTDLWYHDLYARWRTGPAAIAGLTAHGPLFCLERLAWDHGMRVVFRAEHQYRADGRVEHALSAPEEILRDAESLASAGERWSVHVAALVSRCPMPGPHASTCIASPLGHREAAERDPLLSWVIAPVVRAS
jgi:hypothetical protein